MKTAVCISGIASFVPEYEKVIAQAKKVFGDYDFFYQQWEGYEKPNVPNCLYVPEPKWEYHVMRDVKVKPDCDIYRKYTNPNGKMYRKPNLFKQFWHSGNQQMSHHYLVESLPEEYTKIIRMRFDTIVSTKIDYKKYLDMLDDGYTVGWYSGGAKNSDGPGTDDTIEVRGNNGDSCKWRVFDHMLFHNRNRLQNVKEMFDKQELNGSEWGWYQILHHQWGDDKYVNIWGGTSLCKWTKQPLTWENF